jgi:hypothetical protein
MRGYTGDVLGKINSGVDSVALNANLNVFSEDCHFKISFAEPVHFLAHSLKNIATLSSISDLAPTPAPDPGIFEYISKHSRVGIFRVFFNTMSETKP